LNKKSPLYPTRMSPITIIDACKVFVFILATLVPMAYLYVTYIETPIRKYINQKNKIE
jgi:hypothetical protein